MAGFDEQPLFTADRYFADDLDEDRNDRLTQYRNAKQTFKAFIREYKSVEDGNNEPKFIYRSVEVKRH